MLQHRHCFCGKGFIMSAPESLSLTLSRSLRQEEDLQRSEAHMEPDLQSGGPQSRIQIMEDELAAKNMAMEELSCELEEIRAADGVQQVRVLRPALLSWRTRESRWMSGWWMDAHAWHWYDLTVIRPSGSHSCSRNVSVWLSFEQCERSFFLTLTQLGCQESHFLSCKSAGKVFHWNICGPLLFGTWGGCSIMIRNRVKSQ